MCMSTMSQRRSAQSPANSGSPRSAVTSLTMVAPASSAAVATGAFDVSIETSMPGPSGPQSARTTGSVRATSSAAGTASAPGRVDSPPMSRIAAPAAASSRPCPIARSGSRNRPPSEKESGVTFTTPITRAMLRMAPGNGERRAAARPSNGNRTCPRSADDVAPAVRDRVVDVAREVIELDHDLTGAVERLAVLDADHVDLADRLVAGHPVQPADEEVLAAAGVAAVLLRNELRRVGRGAPVEVVRAGDRRENDAEKRDGRDDHRDTPASSPCSLLHTGPFPVEMPDQAIDETWPNLHPRDAPRNRDFPQLAQGLGGPERVAQPRSSARISAEPPAKPGRGRGSGRGASRPGARSGAGSGAGGCSGSSGGKACSSGAPSSSFTNCSASIVSRSSRMFEI